MFIIVVFYFFRKSQSLTFGYIDSWYIFGITLIRIAGMSRASGLSGHLVLVSAGLIHFLIDTTSEHKRTKRMKMSQYDYSVYNFGQRPAIFSFSQFLQTPPIRDRLALAPPTLTSI
jgi:hypothetical protein